MAIYGFFDTLPYVFSLKIQCNQNFYRVFAPLKQHTAKDKQQFNNFIRDK
jgi:hypothetical protein